jgi:hypothetical protein
VAIAASFPASSSVQKKATWYYLQAPRSGNYSCPTIQEIVLVNQYVPSVKVWQRNVEHPENTLVWLYGHDETEVLPGLDMQLATEDIYRNLHFADVEEEDNKEQASLPL